MNTHVIARNERTTQAAEGLPRFNLTDDTCTKPDILVFPAHLVSYDVRGDTALLVVEIADSSLRFDLGSKAGIYASYGVAEYWVINARSLETTVLRDPSPAGYGSVTIVPGADRLVPVRAPALAVTLAGLEAG